MLITAKLINSPITRKPHLGNMDYLSPAMVVYLGRNYATTLATAVIKWFWIPLSRVQQR